MDIISTKASRSNSRAMMAKEDKQGIQSYFKSSPHAHGSWWTAGTSVPATNPDDMVAIAGLPLEVTLVRGWKSRPSLAMANNTRGIGNIEPSRLEIQTQTGSVNGRQNAFSTRPTQCLFNLETDWKIDSSLQHLYADFSALTPKSLQTRFIRNTADLPLLGLRYDRNQVTWWLCPPCSSLEWFPGFVWSWFSDYILLLFP